MKKMHVFLAAALVLLLPAFADAQQLARRVKVDNNGGVRIGFQKGFLSSNTDGFKAGMWAPVFVRLVDDEEGNIILPVAKDGSVSAELLVETGDNDGISNVYTQAFTIAPNEPLQILAYTKLAGANPIITLTIKVGDRGFLVASQGFGFFQAVDLGQHLYLTLGDSLADFHAALIKMAPKNQFNDPGVKETRPRFLFYENYAQNLPANWFGYDAVDLAFLVTSNGKFLDKLTGDRQSSPQLEALADWVRRGGRLVVSIAPANREKVQRLLSSPAWQPALPQVLTLDSKTLPLESLHDLTNWCNALNTPFRPNLDKEGKAQSRLGVRLQPHPAVSVLCNEPDGKGSAPLIVRFPHGTGSITLVAFDVKDQFFTDWQGQPEFWKAVVEKLAPASKVGPGFNQFDGGFGGFDSRQDLSSQLYTALEALDTPTISFGWVALFIFIYIIVVGPVDYLLLKVVFKRLELTWITFPVVVLTVSLLAYFTAYAIKGQDLKVNKVDLIDIDMRSALGEDQQPAGARAFGTTWFTILSPRIQNYTIGIEPVLHNWREGAAAPAAPIEPTISWFGRSEFGGMGAGRGRSPGLFSRTYNYQTNATGLIGVPIPVWTTKSFTASWEVPLDKSRLPFESRLTYEAGERRELSGTLKSNLSFDLFEVYLIQGDKFYPLPNVPNGAEVKLQLKSGAEKVFSAWRDARPFEPFPLDPADFRGAAALFRPSTMLREMMFHEKVDTNSQFRNHTSRALDWSWRCDQDWRPAAEGEQARVKEVILVGRLARAKGLLDSLQSDNDPRLPTHLWLGELPGTPVPGKTRKVTHPDGKVEEVPVFHPRPAMQGSLVQETYLRIILPVKPK